MYSPWFRFYYVIMVSVNLFALVFTIELPIESAHLDWFVALEVFITAMLVIELILRVMAEGRYQFYSLQSPPPQSVHPFHRQLGLFPLQGESAGHLHCGCVRQLTGHVCLPPIHHRVHRGGHRPHPPCPARPPAPHPPRLPLQEVTPLLPECSAHFSTRAPLHECMPIDCACNREKEYCLRTLLSFPTSLKTRYCAMARRGTVAD
jgi:hypothetical protein